MGLCTSGLAYTGSQSQVGCWVRYPQAIININSRSHYPRKTRCSKLKRTPRKHARVSHLISDEEFVSYVRRVHQGRPVHLVRVHAGLLHGVLAGKARQ